MLLAEPLPTPSRATPRRTPSPPTPTAPVCVSISGLRVGYGAKPVLSGADLQVTAGSRTVVLGANGSGKTTLLRCVAGDRQPDAGEVAVCGLRLDRAGVDLPAYQKLVRLVGTQPPGDHAGVDVFSEVASGPAESGLNPNTVRDRVEEALDLLYLADVAGRQLGELSYGERKRVALAGAVASRPAVVLLDEPTEGLDARGRSRLIAALQLLTEESVTLVVATHDADFALSWAESVAVIEAGRIRYGEPLALLTDSRLVSGSGLRKPLVVRVLAGLGENPDGVTDVLGLVGRLGDLLDARDAAAGAFPARRA